MIVIKFEKTGGVAYIAHLDLMRSFTLALRRANIEVKYSEGFNPHILIFFSSPLSVGLQSRAEYVCIETLESAKDVIKKLSATLPQGIGIISAEKRDINPNYAAILAAAEYEIELDSAANLKQALQDIMASDSYSMEFTKLIKNDRRGRSETKEKDIRNRILQLTGSGKKYKMLLLCGNFNLRPDKLLENILKTQGLSHITSTIIKTKAFALKNKTTDAEQIYKQKDILEGLVDFDNL